jgi:hypothetical protein
MGCALPLLKVSHALLRPVDSLLKERSSMPHSFIVAASVLAIAVLTPGLTLAQEGTPTSDFVTPDPGECRIAPRSIESIASALATPAARTPTTVRSGGDAAAGQPADAETRAAVTALAREAAACGNAGDYQRVFALYTDNGLRVFAADRGMVVEQMAGALAVTPVPLPEEAWQGVRVRDVRIHSNERVTAFIDFRSPQGIGTVFIGLVQQADRYLVDSEVVVPPAPATPVP